MKDDEEVTTVEDVKSFQSDLQEVLNEIPAAPPLPSIVIPPPEPPIVNTPPPPIPEEVRKATAGQRKLVYPARKDAVCTCGHPMVKYEDGKFWNCIRFVSVGMTPTSVCKARVPLNMILDKLPEKAPAPESLPIE